MQVTYRRNGEVSQALAKISTENGILSTGSAPFLGAFIDAIARASASDFARVYELAANVDIATATGSYLDRWGSIMGEKRTTRSYAADLSLDNVEVYLDPEVTAGTITTDGGGIDIPEGMTITDDEGSVEFFIVEAARIRPTRGSCFVKVVASDPGISYVAANQLATISLALSDVENINAGYVGTYALRVRNARSISGGTSLADDELYRYILQQRGASMGLFNDAKINTVMDVETVASIHVDEYIGGINVYVETTEWSVQSLVVEYARALLREMRPRGLPVNVYGPYLPRLNWQIDLTLVDPALQVATHETFKASIVDQVSMVRMGSSIDLDATIATALAAAGNITDVRVRAIRKNARSVIGTSIAFAFNERPVTTTEDINLG